MDHIIRLLTPQLGQQIKLNPTDKLTIVCGEDFQTISADTELFCESNVIANMVKLVKRVDFVDTLLFDKLTDGYVLYLPEPVELISLNYIETVEDFYEYVKFAAKYMLNIPNICEDLNKTLWFHKIKIAQKKLWQSNNKILTNVEQQQFNQSKFVSNPAPVHAGAYPVYTSATPRPINLRGRAIPAFLSDMDFSIMLTILTDNYADQFAKEIVFVLGTSIDYFTIILNNAIARNIFTSKSIAMYYPFRIMYLEELAMYKRLTFTDRIIMRLEHICGLEPCIRPLQYNELIPLLAKHCSNTLLLPTMMDGIRGLYSLPEARNRIHEFTYGLLSKIEWEMDGCRAMMNGSAISACVIRNPLEQYFKSFSAYLSEYYPAQTGPTAAHNGPTRANDAIYDEESMSNDTPKPSSDSDSEDDVDHNISYSDIDLMLECDFDEFDKYVNIYFRAIESASKYPLTLTRVETENKHKFIITGAPRQIDVFHVNNHLEVLVKYHLGCVRAGYNGQTVICFPSFIVAALTGVNVDIRWTSNRKDVRDIVLKYLQRGFGTVLNSTDANDIRQYVYGSSQWPGVAPANMNRWRLQHYLRKSMFHDNVAKIFNPSVHRTGIHHNLDTPMKRISTVNTSQHRNVDNNSVYKMRTEHILPFNLPDIATYW